MAADEPTRFSGEPDAHRMMRWARSVLGMLLILATLATIILILLHWQVAYLAAFPTPVLFLAFISVCYLERQSRAEVLRGAGDTAISQDEVELDIRFAGLYTALFLLIFLALSALVIAATLVIDWSMVGLVAGVILLLSILIMLPYIPLFIMDSSREEQEKLEQDSETASDAEPAGQDTVRP
jgi:hypothetical protein